MHPSRPPKFDAEVFNKALREACERMAEHGKRFQEAARMMVRRISEAGSDAEPYLIESRSEARYQARVRQERALGLDYVRNKAAQVRRDLGLPED